MPISYSLNWPLLILGVVIGIILTKILTGKSKASKPKDENNTEQVVSVESEEEDSKQKSKGGSNFIRKSLFNLPAKEVSEGAFCVKCGESIASPNDFCTSCGFDNSKETENSESDGDNEANPQFHCTNCSEPLEAKNDFCTNCGHQNTD